MAVQSLQLHRFLVLCALLFIVHVHAKCSHPSVRREWRQLSKAERADWINAVKCLGKLPHDPSLTRTVDPSLSLIPPINTTSSFWDDIVYMHMDLNFLIHFTGFFLPFHRQFVWSVEKAMKDKCGFKGVQPYWDWTQDAPDFYSATIFDNDPKSGLGGWGDPNNDYQITTGGFSKGFKVAYPVPHRVRRNFTLQPFLGVNAVPNPNVYINTTFSKTNTDFMVGSFGGDFEGFQAYFESLNGPHPGPHLILGCDMAGNCPGNAGPDCVAGAKWTPNDAMFFLHHAMVDKLWYDWQNRNESSRYAFEGGSVSVFGNNTLFAQYPTGAPPFLNYSSIIPGDGLMWKNVTVGDVMDTTCEKFCYIYE